MPLALLGFVGIACVVFRMADRPAPVGELVSLSLREGAWLALLGCACMSAGALWTPSEPAVRPAKDGGDIWSELSGWTPET